MSQFLIALGANLPFGVSDLGSTLSSALTRLNEHPRIKVDRISRFFRTPAFPPGAGPEFLNAAASLESDLDAIEILQILHRVEQEFGRDRTERWGARVIDLDLLAAGSQILPDIDVVRSWVGLGAEAAAKQTPDKLILPHPRLHERGFVLIPLRDVAPDWIHPIFQKSVASLAEELPERELAEITPL